MAIRGKLIREWGAFVFSVVATALSIASFTQTWQNSKTTNRLEADRLLNEAWDLMGGKPGTNVIADYVTAPDQLELASRKIDEAKLVAPKYARSYWIAASLALARKQYDEAEKSCRVAIACDPTAAAPYNRLGQLHVMLARWREAADDYQHALKLRPGEAMLHSNLCYALCRLDNLGDAAAECNRAIALDPQYLQAFANLAEVQARQGRTAESNATLARLDKLQANQ